MTALIVLIGMACFLPSFAVYLTLFLVLIRLCMTYHKPAFAAARLTRGVSNRFNILVYVSLLLFAQIVSYVSGQESLPLTKVIREWLNVALKHGVVWLVLVLFFRQYAVARGLDLWRIGKVLFGIALANFLYVLIQRHSGIDLSHGLSARLPDYRFAYGAFRASGAFGHPLTLAYSQLLLAVAALVIARDYVTSAENPRTRTLWYALSGVFALTLFFTGSRWPVAVYGIVLVAFGWRAFWQHKKLSLLFLIAAMGLVVIEGSWIGRIQEIGRSVSLAERTDQRMVFWQVHWQIFKDYPVFGAGNLNINAIREAYYAALPVHDKIYSAHNIFLQVLADSGVVGFLSLLALFAVFFIPPRKLASATPPRMRGLVYLGVALALGGLMQDVLRDSEVLFVLWVTLAFLEALTLSRSGGSIEWMKASSKFPTTSGSSGS